MKKLIILGATGSIGTQTLEVVRQNKIEYKIVAISIGHNIQKAKEIIKEFAPKYVSVIEEKDAIILKNIFPEIKIESGEESLVACATFDKEAILINSVVGICGLKPTIKALEKGMDILLANKETLVTGGEIITKLIKKTGSKLFPIDSEHSAIYQCLLAGKKENVHKLIITASGGSLRDKSRKDLENIKIEEVLNHPNWSMGKKITVDSATMVNKGLEVIEAHFLFDISYEKIETIIHKESIIHSMVEYNDGSVIAQMATPDMMIPIQYALTYPEKKYNSDFKYLDFSKLKKLSFEKMDFERFPCLYLAYKAGKMGGIMPTIYNASNEIAVELFLKGKIKFLDIEYIIKNTMDSYPNITNPLLEDILKIDQEVKEKILRKYEV